MRGSVGENVNGVYLAVIKLCHSERSALARSEESKAIGVCILDSRECCKCESVVLDSVI